MLTGWCRLAITISLLALIATFYQLYLQRVHNEKSLRPLGQIDFIDRKDTIYVHVQNNGVGPLIIDSLVFLKDDKHYPNIKVCLDLDPKSYMSYDVSDSAKKVVLPGACLEIFSTQFEPDEGETQKDFVRNQLSKIVLKAYCRDIYNSKITIERDFHWFIAE